MLLSIEFKEDFRCFKKSEMLHFRPGINLLVGDQGSGKSTVLTLLREQNKRESVLSKGNKIKVVTDGVMQSFSFDFEKDNPRKANYIDSMDQVMTMFSSHGQSVNAILNALPGLSTGKDTIFLIDEPDMALSIRSVFKLIETLKETVKSGCQIIVSAHNPLLISAFDEVYSLEHRKWMKSDDFIESQKKPQETGQKLETELEKSVGCDSLATSRSKASTKANEKGGTKVEAVNRIPFW